MRKFNIGDIIFVYYYNNKSRLNDDPKFVRLNRNNLVNHWRGKCMTQYFIINGEKIRTFTYGNVGGPFSTIVRLDEENAIIVSDSLTTARGRINAEYRRREKNFWKNLKKK